ncbi:glycosyltransferase [Candidatus Woesearchaeota archaeon]|jgi:glycosyltransferase involved in cell wall biosynthesis|nr:glycosyltransferase [Candidatus Woesearchaeota archaeon]
MALTLSVCLILKNEEDFIESCIHNVLDIVDEIIIVDTGSTDKTIEILSKIVSNNSKIKLFNFKWVDDFSAARNFSLSKATGDWILILDPDELIDKEDLKKLRKTIEYTVLAGFQLIQRTYTNDSNQSSWRPVNLNDTYSRGFSGYFDVPITRIFKNNPLFKFTGQVHEDITPSIREQKKPLLKSDIIIHHYEYSRGENFVKDKQLYYLELTLKKIKDQPQNPKAYADAGIIYYSYKKDLDRALYYFNETIKVDPGYSMAYNYIAKILSEKGKDQEARIVLKNCVDNGFGNDTSCLNLARIYVKIGQPEKAIKYYNILIDNNHPQKEIFLRKTQQLKNNIV